MLNLVQHLTKSVATSVFYFSSRLNLHRFVRNLPEHLREVESLDSGRRKLKDPALIEADRVLNHPIALGDIFIIGSEGLEGAFLKGRPGPALPLLPLG